MKSPTNEAKYVKVKLKFSPLFVLLTFQVYNTSKADNDTALEISNWLLYLKNISFHNSID